MTDVKVVKETPIDFLRLLLLKDHSYTYVDLFKFFLNFLIVYSAFFISMIGARYAALPKNQALDSRQWTVLFVTPIVLTFITYLRELYATRNTDRQVKFDKVVFGSINGAIEKFIERLNTTRASSDHKDGMIQELLSYCERIMFQLLETDGAIKSGVISANLMVKKKGEDKLILKYFGNVLTGRRKIELDIDLVNLKPGAPTAYVTKSVVYVDNTDSKIYKPFFAPDRPYKSIVSIPIFNHHNDNVFAILNMDSETPNQFVSSDYIQKRILPIFAPIIALLRLELLVISRISK